VAAATARPRRSLPTNRRLEYPAGTAPQPPKAESGSRERHSTREQPSRPGLRTGRPDNGKGTLLHHTTSTTAAPGAWANESAVRRPPNRSDGESSTSQQQQQRPAMLQQASSIQSREVTGRPSSGNSEEEMSEGGSHDREANIADLLGEALLSENADRRSPAASTPALMMAPVARDNEPSDDLGVLLATSARLAAQAEHLMAEVAWTRTYHPTLALHLTSSLCVLSVRGRLTHKWRRPTFVPGELFDKLSNSSTPDAQTGTTTSLLSPQPRSLTIALSSSHLACPASSRAAGIWLCDRSRWRR
jgi:hypothetical protein